MIPVDYVIHKFYQFAGYVKYKKSTKVYEGGCCICREGKSWGQKRRLYFLVDDNIICCHNCGWYSKPADWIQEVAGISWNELIKETQEYDYIPDLDNQTTKQQYTIPDLPHDCINLFDTHQLRYYKDNSIVKKCLDIIAERRLDTAINKPLALYTSLADKTHKNRLIIPFYDDNNKVIHYQSRRILNDNTPKYLSKTNSEKSLFNFNNVSTSDHVFIFEGPIDSCFVQNSIAVAGIQNNGSASFTPIQSNQFAKFILSKKIWVLDNDTTGISKSIKLLERDECVFIWPRELRDFKDMNDLCMFSKRDSIDPDFILKHTYCGLKGLVKIKSRV